MIHNGFLLLLVSLLVGCATITPSRSFTRSAYPDMFAALDSQPDGYQGTVKTTGEAFRIRSTHANTTRLCRLVEIQGTESFYGESFCKAKGGEWR